MSKLDILGPFVFGISGTKLTADERALFEERPPTGIILFSRNVGTPIELKNLIADIQQISQDQCLIFIDQEGGRVQRLHAPFWREYPNISQYSHLSDQEFADAVYTHYQLLARELHAVGIKVNCAPVLDVKNAHTAVFLQDRIFDENIERVKNGGELAIKAMQAEGVAAVIKHIPGHGHAHLDSHINLPKVIYDHNPFEKFDPELEVFSHFQKAEIAMTSHILYPQIDEDFPMTISKKGIDFIRKNIGFKGVLISDDINMKALTGDRVELSRKAFDTGIELVLHCDGNFEEMKAINAIDMKKSERVNNWVKKVHAFEPISNQNTEELESKLDVLLPNFKPRKRE